MPIQYGMLLEDSFLGTLPQSGLGSNWPISQIPRCTSPASQIAPAPYPTLWQCTICDRMCTFLLRNDALWVVMSTGLRFVIIPVQMLEYNYRSPDCIGNDIPNRFVRRGNFVLAVANNLRARHSIFIVFHQHQNWRAWLNLHISTEQNKQSMSVFFNAVLIFRSYHFCMEETWEHVSVHWQQGNYQLCICRSSNILHIFSTIIGWCWSACKSTRHHWFRLWLGVIKQQAISWTNVYQYRHSAPLEGTNERIARKKSVFVSHLMVYNSYLHFHCHWQKDCLQKKGIC